MSGLPKRSYRVREAAFLPWVADLHLSEHGAIVVYQTIASTGHLYVSHILVIDDDKDLCVIMQEILRAEGYKVSVAELGESRELYTLQVIRAAQQLDRAIQNAERGQRGYLLTNDRKYLTPYEGAIGQIPALEDQLPRVGSTRTSILRAWAVIVS